MNLTWRMLTFWLDDERKESCWLEAWPLLGEGSPEPLPEWLMFIWLWP